MLKVNDRVVVLAAPYQQHLNAKAAKMKSGSTEHRRIQKESADFGWMAREWTITAINGDMATISHRSTRLPLSCLVKLPDASPEPAPHPRPAQPYPIGAIVDALFCHYRVTAVHEAGSDYEYELKPTTPHTYAWHCDRWNHRSLKLISLPAIDESI